MAGRQLWDSASGTLKEANAPDTPAYVQDSSATKFVPVTKANTNLTLGACRGLLVGTAGTANLMDASGVTRTNVPLQVGYNPLSCLQVMTGGTATDIWALYS